MQKWGGRDKCSAVTAGFAKKFRIGFVRDKAERAVHRAFISATRNSLSRTQQTEEEM
jgi:hypothetical protein